MVKSTLSAQQGPNLSHGEETLGMDGGCQPEPGSARGSPPRPLSSGSTGREGHGWGSAASRVPWEVPGVEITRSCKLRSTQGRQLG